MRLSLNKFHLYWFSIWFLVLAYLLFADTVLSKEISATKVFSQNQYAISYIFPLGRTEVASTRQTFLDEPLYTTVYAPRLYNKARVHMKFDSDPEGWSIGVQNAPGFSYRLTPLSRGTEQTIELAIEDSITQNNRLRFIFAHEDDIQQHISLEELTITLSEPRHTYFNELLRQVKRTHERVATIF